MTTLASTGLIGELIDDLQNVNVCSLGLFNIVEIMLQNTFHNPGTPKMCLGYESFFQRIVLQGGSRDCEPRAHGEADEANGGQEQGQAREDRQGAGKED